MNKANNDSRRIKQYLLDDMPDEEHEKFEELLLAEDNLFYELEDAENELVDSYVREGLADEELERFEKSLERIPARRVKVANAAALHRLIGEERREDKTITIAERSGFLDNFRTIFRSPVFGYSMAGMFLIASVTAILLRLENRRMNNEIARVQAELSNRQTGNDLERQLAESRAKETELQTQIDGEKNVSGDLTADLERERENRRRLEAEITDLRNQKPDGRPERDAPEPPTIAAITLRPVGSRGTGDVTFSLNRNANVKRVSVLLTLPANTGDDERLSVQLNGKTIAQNLKVRTEPNGTKTLAVTVPKADLTLGPNKLTVMAVAKQVGEYNLAMGQE